MAEVVVAEHSDIEQIVESGAGFWNEHFYSRVGAYDPAQTRNVLHNMVDGDMTIVIAAKENAKIVGYIAFIATPIIWGEAVSAIEAFRYVDKDHRRQGIGTELLDAGAEWAEIMGCSLVEYYTHDGKRVPRWINAVSPS
jgi:GNAT superfamily N-acetyltransferase